MFADGAGHVAPQAGPGAGVHSGSLAGEADVLAREPAAQHVDRPVVGEHLAPVDGGDVAEVRHVGPVVGQDPGGVLVGVRPAVFVGRLVLGVPDDVAAEDAQD